MRPEVECATVTREIARRLAQCGITAVSVVLSLGCESAAKEAGGPTVIRFGAPAAAFVQQLATASSRAGRLNVRLTETRREKLEAISQNEADVALTTADVAYFTYRTSTTGRRNSDGLRAIATLHVNALQLVVNGTSGVSSLHGLSGYRLGVMNPLLIELLLQAFKLNGQVQKVTTPFAKVAHAMRTGAVDAFSVAGYYPSAIVETALQHGGRLVSIEGPEVSRLVDEYPFIHRVAIPAGTYRGQPEPVYTVGVDVIYVCRRDLSEAVVYELTEALFAALPALSKNFPILRSLDVKQTAATVIPLHDGAARYYRSVEIRP